MKTILIIGDSWGVPNYEGPKLGADPSEYLEYRLRKLGYKVYNCALNGASNSRTVDLAKAYLSGNVVTLEPVRLVNNFHKLSSPTVIDVVNPKIDHVIWFHTESLRAFFDYQTKSKTMVENLDHGYRKEYEHVKEFLQTLNAHLTVIGGQSPIYKKFFYEYFKPDFIIEDWRSEIVGRKLPEIHWLTHPIWIDDCADDKDTKLNMANISMEIIDAMINCRDFVDNCHPGPEPHRLLTQQLHKLFMDPL